jgi:hypothetical protein
MASNAKGGGIGSRVHREVRHNPKANVKGVRPAGVQMLGTKQGNHIMEDGKTSYRGERWDHGVSFQPVPMGNTLTNNVGLGGPGKGRTLYGQSGTQQQYGAANPGNAPPAGDALAGWAGPNSNSTVGKGR